VITDKAKYADIMALYKFRIIIIIHWEYARHKKG